MKRYILCLFLTLPFLSAGYSHIETEHFVIHFKEGYEKTALTIQSYCEEIYEDINSFLKTEFPETTHIVIDPLPKGVNAFNTGVPKNLIVLYTNPPFQTFSLENDGANWLHSLLIHEMSHNIHLNRKEGGIGFLTKVFGPAFLNFWKNPDPWNREGFAVYLETKLAKGNQGRLKHPYYHNLALYQAKSGEFPDIYQVNREPGLWLMNSAYYIYGSLFTEYLAETYGEDKLIGYFKQSTSLFPLFKDIPFYRIYGKWPPEIWEEFKHHYEEMARALPHIKEDIGEASAMPNRIDIIAGKIYTIHWDTQNTVYIKSRGPSKKKCPG